MADNKWNGENPWMGLAPYTEGTTLYGRCEECSVLSEIIKNNIASIVFGKSGIGKSSLLSAGISPLLRDENYIPIRIRLVHNTDVSYVEQIKRAIRENIICEDQLETSLPEFGLWDFFHRHIFSSTNGDMCIPVIILDQFEEIYTLTDSEHKNSIIEFFAEVSSLLNDIKPDAVVEYEKTHSTSETGKEETANAKGLILKRSNGNTLKYIPENNFRFVVCLREDKLYLLERNSVNIPSFKTNRYNLHALSPQSAIEVIMCPLPDLFSNEEAMAIVDKIADVGEEGMRTIDPAILSLFLYKYFEKQGATNYDNIFAEYYRESTEGIKAKSIAFLENHLLTLGGYRNQIPLDDAIESGVSRSDVKKLLEKVILRTEKRKDIDYIEFSHDRLCEEAKRSRDERVIKTNRKKIKRKITITTFFVLCFASFLYIGYYNNLISKKNTQLKNSKDSLMTVNEKYSALYTMYKNRGDSLVKKNVEINNAKDSLAMVSEERLKLLSYSELQKRRISRLLEIERASSMTIMMQSDSIKYANMIIQERGDSISNVNVRLDENIQSLSKHINDRRTFDEVVRLLCSLRNAYESRDFQLLSKINEALKDYELSYITGIECVSEDAPPLKGHLIFDTEYIDAFIQGKSTSSFEKHYDHYKSLRGVVDATTLRTKTFTVKANEITKLKFIDRDGWAEFAIITEPKGLINVVINNKTLGIKRALKENGGKGSSLCQFPQILDFGMMEYEVELEVINCTDIDISFVVATSW